MKFSFAVSFAAYMLLANALPTQSESDSGSSTQPDIQALRKQYNKSSLKAPDPPKPETPRLWCSIFGPLHDPRIVTISVQGLRKEDPRTGTMTHPAWISTLYSVLLPCLAANRD